MKKESQTILIIAVVLIAGIFVVTNLNQQPITKTAELSPQYIEGACLVEFFTTPGGCTVTFAGNTKTSNSVANTALSFGYIDSSVARTYPYSVSKSGYTLKSGTVSISLNARYKSVYVTLTASGGTAPPVTPPVPPPVTPPVPPPVTPPAAPTTFNITLTVVDKSTLLPLNNALVTIESNQKSTENGQVKFTQMSAKAYTIYAIKSEYNDTTDSVTVTTQDVYKTVYMTKTPSVLPKTWVITVSVVDYTSNTNIDGATVVFNSTTQTTVGGIAHFDAITGTYPVTIVKQSYVPSSATVPINSNTTLIMKMISEAAVPPSAPGKYSLTVVTTPDATVRLNEKSMKNTSGIVTFTNLTSNSYTLSIEKTGYTSYGQTVIINNANAAVTYMLQAPSKGIPGFELPMLLVAFGIAFLLFRRKKR
jgi:hypothetical protein